MNQLLRELEIAAYLDPSQENLAKYVKELEAEIENLGDLAKELEDCRAENYKLHEQNDNVESELYNLESELYDLKNGETK
jgi:hypothetical protein